MGPFTEELMERNSHITRTRQQIDRPGDSVAAAEANKFWLAADIAPIVLSACPLNAKCVSIIALYRRADQPMFSERDRMVAHILLTEAFWLHAEGWPEDFGARTPELSRQLRLVLNLLLEGYSRKMIADQLHLSVHTVSDYVKKIYANFNVQSHAELMRRFTRGKGV
jgi:DNA-binding NarL/FixJ family response regulator